MIQDIFPYVFDNHYEEQSPDDDSFLIFWQQETLFVRKEGEKLAFPKKRDFPEEQGPFTYLFSISGQRFFLVTKEQKQELPGYFAAGKNDFRRALPRHISFAGVTAIQIASFYRKHRRCGICGGELIHDRKERMLFCPACKAPVYPTISPAVIVAVTKGDKLLMTKYAGRQYANYALVAGFAEVGESIEDTVRREVLEETGIHVKNIRYYKSQPWSISETLLFGFFCEADGEEEIRLDENELSLACWMSREEIPTRYDGVSLTNEMITLFQKGELPAPPRE